MGGAGPSQAQDPLAPIAEPATATEPAAPAPPPSSPRSSALVRPRPSPPRTARRAPVSIPRDWRGVFDAIRSGNWASARAGIAVLPPSVLTPLAKAELYTAKGSPAVDLAPIQALLAEAPELPQAEQLARMALARGATTDAADHSQRRALTGSARRRAAIARGRSRAKPPPTSCAPRSIR